MVLSGVRCPFGLRRPPGQAAESRCAPSTSAAPTSIIAAGYRDSGENPSEGRDITLPTGKSLHVDVGTVGRKYGVAYLTAGGSRGARRQARSPAPSAQRRFAYRPRGGADSGAVILVLFADDYQYDDLAGESHESTNITAEK